MLASEHQRCSSRVIHADKLVGQFRRTEFRPGKRTPPRAGSDYAATVRDRLREVLAGFTLIKDGISTRGPAIGDVTHRALWVDQR